MKKSDLKFDYPESLVGTAPEPDSRVMLCEQGDLFEVSKQALLEKIPSGDLIVVNETKVVKRRVFSEEGLEILFLEAVGENQWQVLFPAKKAKVGQWIHLPGGMRVELIEKGLPQLVKSERPLTESYFLQYGEMALPPYIQKARGERHNRDDDDEWYQTQWAKNEGSTAAPTASLHFTNLDWAMLKARGVFVEALTLHVGLGTFLPVHAENLEEHSMHSEAVTIPRATLEKIYSVKASGGKVWALGTTVTRALESIDGNYFKETAKGDLIGETDIFICPGFEFKVVDRLMTNFHQPESTLLALVSAFAGLEFVKFAYTWAIEKKFRLFSYGDLSVWIKN